MLRFNSVGMCWEFYLTVFTQVKCVILIMGSERGIL